MTNEILEVNESEIVTVIKDGSLFQYIRVELNNVLIGTYWAKTSNSILEALDNRTELFDLIKKELQYKYHLKINRI